MPYTPWLEVRGRHLTLARANYRCELCRETPVEMSHRIARSGGGTWAPGNLIALCHRCHAWAHDKPLLSGAGVELDTGEECQPSNTVGGWRLPSTADYLAEPAFLLTEIGFRWVLLNDAGEYVNHDIVPVLPPWVPYAQ